MHFSSLVFQLPVLAALLATAAAADIRAYQGTGCDKGTSVYYANVKESTCIGIPVSGGVRFTNIPAGAKGQVYYNSGCSSFAQGGGTGTYCLNIKNNMRSANWFVPSKRLARREQYTGEMTTGVRYTTADGSERYIRCLIREFKHVLDLVEAKDWDALAQYPDDPNPPKSQN